MPPSTTVTMTGLTNGTAYTFTVFANNGAGSGPSSAPSPAVTVGAPVAPPTASAVSSDTKAVVSWTAPANNGSPITGYVVTPVVGFFTLAPQTFNTTGTTATVTGLTNGTTYRFLVAAKNVRGTGATTLSGPVKVGAPVAPATAAGTAGNGSVAVAWSASPNPAGSPVTGYVVTPIVGFVPLTAQTFAAAATSGTVTGLTNGTTYRFSVAAKNSVGTGPNVITGPIIAGVPGAATAVGVASGSTATTTGPLTVSYGAGANNGAAITLFTATCTSSNGGVTRSATHTGPTAGPITVTGATTGKSYTCTVATANSRGTGAASAGSAVVVVGAPARPNVPAVVKSASGAIRVTFSAPANNGAAISGYSATCQSTNGGVTASKTGTASPLNVTGLTTGKSYTCTVVATNARGAGPVSAASAAVTA
jgi:titin